MPTDKDFKRLVRARMGKTGEAYTTARAHLRPDGVAGQLGDPGRAGPLRGRHPDTAALARLLAALGVTDPATGRPLSEAMTLGVAGGIGVAYFVFEYEEEDLTTFYLGGRINSYVQRQDAGQAALARLGVPVQVRKTSGPATAERQLRSALDQGRPVIVTVDVARLLYRAVPDWLCGMTPQDVLVELRGAEPVLWDLAPAPIPVTWAELATARAGVRSAKHRLVVAEPPPGPVDLAGAAAAGIADTWRGMLEPPMRNFGVPGLGKWADLLIDGRDPKGWPRLLAAPGRQFQLLTWLYDWVETAGTGGGFFRAMYAEFLEAAAGPLERPELARLAGDYRRLAAAWTAMAEAAVAAGGDGPLARAAALLDRRRRLVEDHGAAAAEELAAVQAELDGLARAATDPQPLGPAAVTALLADLRRRVQELAEEEAAAADALRGAVPSPRPQELP
jgi:Domain of unknown function (DUF4872)/Butirosin biosynthesis protein H, N-terminal